MKDLPILERRRIEARMLAHVHAELTERLGRAEADSLLGAAVTRAAIDQGQEMAADLGRAPDLSDFLDILPLWTKDGALEIEMLEAGPDRLDFNVRACRYAQMYREMGLGEIGHLLSCNRDGDFCLGYNPEMELTRTQTIMSGATHCDFRYRMKTPDDPT